MAKIKEWTINRFYDEVCAWYDADGNEKLVKKALSMDDEADKNSVIREKENIYKGTIYTVLWSILVLTDKEKRNAFSGKLASKRYNRGVENGGIPHLVEYGCKLSATYNDYLESRSKAKSESKSKSKRFDGSPNFPIDFFGYQDVNDVYDYITNKLVKKPTGDMAIKDVLEPIIKYIGIRRNNNSKRQI